MSFERLGVIIALVVQLIGFGTLYGRLEQRVTSLETLLTERGQVLQDIPVRIARLEVRIETMLEELRRVSRQRQPASGTDWNP